MDEVDQEIFDDYVSVRGRNRRKFLVASSFMGALAAVEPWFARLARAEQAGARSQRQTHPEGRAQLPTMAVPKFSVTTEAIPPIMGAARSSASSETSKMRSSSSVAAARLCPCLSVA
jgi:hypothetical protein